MANTSLSSARRGRARVSRDYTAKLRTDAYVREAGRTAKMSTIGMIGSFAAGAAELAAVAKTNVKGWERLQEGGEALHKEGKHKGDFDLATSLGRGDKPISTWEKWTTQAPVTEQLSIGDDQFYGINVAQVGALGESAGLLVDKDSDKNLYDYLKKGGDKGAKTDVIASLETMKQARPKQVAPVVKKIDAQSSNQSSLQYPKPPAQTIDWDSLLWGDEPVGEMPDYDDDFSDWTAPVSKQAPAFSQDISGYDNDNQGSVQNKFDWFSNTDKLSNWFGR
jgi:hypothetical protein